MKAYSLNDSTTAIFDASIASHDTDSLVIAGMNPGKLDNLELAASYGLRHLYGDFTVSPKYKLIYKSYDTGLNDGRDDLSHVLSLNRLSLSESFKLSAFGGFTSRDSSSGLDEV